MPSAQFLINRALKMGILDAGESPTATESTDILDVLNALIGQWNMQDNMATSASIVAQGLTPSAGSYVLGTRYVKVASASVVTAAGTWPTEVVDAVKWNTLVDRDISGNWVKYLFYDRGATSPTIYLSPKPLGGTENLTVWTPQPTFAGLGTTNTLLPGYELALVSALAIEIAPMFMKKVSDEAILSYKQAMDEIKRLNGQLWASVPAAAA